MTLKTKNKCESGELYKSKRRPVTEINTSELTGRIRAVFNSGRKESRIMVLTTFIF